MAESAKFSFDPRDTYLATYSPASAISARKAKMPVAASLRGVQNMATKRAKSDQFQVFQLHESDTGNLLMPGKVDPAFQGDTNPDVTMSVKLEAFHPSESENVSSNSAAAIRMVLGGGDGGTGDALAGLFWTAVSGVRLYNHAKKHRSAPRELEWPGAHMFARTPVHVPGGLLDFGFQVIEPRQPNFFDRLLGFFTSSSGRAITGTLSTAIGFPGVIPAGINLIDQAVNQLMGNNAKELMSGSNLRYALSRHALTELGADEHGSVTTFACLRPGRWLLVRGRDLTTFAERPARYWWDLGQLAPADLSEIEVRNGRWENPYADVTYAVLRVRMSETNLSNYMLLR